MGIKELRRLFTNRIIIFLLLIVALAMSSGRAAFMQTGGESLRLMLLNAPAQSVHDFTVDQTRALVATTGGLYSYDGAAWQRLIEEESFAVAERAGLILAGTRSGLMASEDGGKSWRVSDQGLDRDVLPLSIQISPVRPNEIFIGTDRHGVYRSDDGAKNWSAVSKGLPHSLGVQPFAAVKRMAASPSDSNLVFASTDSHGVYISRDRGENWTEAKTELPGAFHHRVSAPFIAFDEKSPSTIYILVNFPRHSHLLEHSIHRSADGGETWTLVGNLEPNQHIFDFKVSGIEATVNTADKSEKIDLEKLAASMESNSMKSKSSISPQQNDLPGVEPDFDTEDIAVLHDDTSFYSIITNDLRGFGTEVAKRFYQRHGDDYDVIITYADRFYGLRTAGFNAFAYNAPVINTIAGIGVPITTFGGGPASFGSRNSRLLGFCNMNNLNQYPQNPQQAFAVTYNTLDILAHEVGHTWSSYVNFDDNGATSDELLDRTFSHWSFFFDSDASFMQGNDYEDLGGGMFRTVGASSRFNNLDQYLMGLRTTIDPVFFINDPTKVTGVTINGSPVNPKSLLSRSLPPLAPPEFGIVTVEGTRRNVSIQEIQAIEGERFPEPSPEVSKVKAAFVLIVPQGREPDPASLAMIKNLRKQFPDFYNKATDGLGSIDATLKAEGGSDQTPPVVNVTFPRGGESIDAGSSITVTWNASDENGLAKQDIALSLDGGATYTVPVASKLNSKAEIFSFRIPADLNAERAQIQVTAFDYAGNKTSATSGGVFIIKRETVAPSVKVETPNGGERIVAGSRLAIAWNTSDNGTIGNHEVRLSRDGGNSFDVTIAAGLLGFIRSFNWTVPPGVETENAVIEVVSRDVSGNEGRDRSDKPFSIVAMDKVPPQVRLTSPIGGEALQAGGTFSITWTSSDNAQLASHELTLSTDGGQNFNATIATGLSGAAQNFLWNVPDIEINAARIRIAAVDAQNNRGADASASNFEITRRDVTAPLVKVLSPNGGETVRAGEKLSISWQTSDNVSVQSQRVALSLDGGGTFSTVIAANLAAGVSSFTFSVPDSISATAQARIEVSAVDAAGNTGRDISDANFNIAAKDSELPKVTVLSPNGGEVAASGDGLRVAWRSSDNSGIVSHDVQISLDNGANFITLQSGLAGTAQESVINLAGLQSEQARVRIIARDAANNAGSDDSDNTFAVALRPTIGNAIYKNNKKLTIIVTGASASASVEINGQAAAVGVKFQARKGALILKGAPGQLNLRQGENLIVVKERGLASAPFRLIL